MEDRKERPDVVENSGGRVAVDEACVGKVVVLIQIGGKGSRIEGDVGVLRVQHRGPAVALHKVRVAPAVDTVVEDEHPVPGLGQAGKGGLEAEDPLAGEDEGLLVCCVEEFFQVAADAPGEGIERGIQIRIGAGKREGRPDVLRHLGGAGGHDRAVRLQGELSCHAAFLTGKMRAAARRQAG